MTEEQKQIESEHHELSKSLGYREESTPELVSKRLNQAMDPTYMEAIYKEMCFLSGAPYRKGQGGGLDSGKWPVFPVLKRDKMKVGESRRMLDALDVNLSLLRGSDPEFTFSLVNEYKGEQLTQFFKDRINDGYGECGEDLTQCVSNGYAFGYGDVEVALQDSRMRHPRTGEPYQRGTLRSHSPLHTLRDKFNLNPNKGRWWACYDPMTREDALAEYGKDAVKGTVETMRADRSNFQQEVVPRIRYFDLGWTVGDTPKAAVYLGNMNNRPVFFDDSHSPQCLPKASCFGMIPPGAQDPIGSVFRQMALNEAIKEAEESLRLSANRPNLVIIDSLQIKDDTLVARLKSKYAEDHNVLFIESTLPLGKLIHVVEWTADYNGLLLNLKNLEANLDRAEGLGGAIGYGQMQDQKRTLGEVEEQLARGDRNSAGRRKMVADCYGRVVRTGAMVWGQYDTEPFMADVFGANVRINDPDDMNTSLWLLLQERFQVLIGEESLTPSDDRRKREQLARDFMGFIELAGPAADRAKLATEWAKRRGLFESPESYIRQAPEGGGGGMDAQGFAQALGLG